MIKIKIVINIGVVYLPSTSQDNLQSANGAINAFPPSKCTLIIILFFNARYSYCN